MNNKLLDNDRDLEIGGAYHRASLSSMNSYEFIVGVLFGVSFGFFGVVLVNVMHIISIRIISLIAQISYHTLSTKRIRDVSISKGLVYGFAVGIMIRTLIYLVSFVMVIKKIN